MKELDDLKKKHKLKDDFLIPKPAQNKNKYGGRGKAEPLLGAKNAAPVHEVKCLFNDSKNRFLINFLAYSTMLR